MATAASHAHDRAHVVVGTFTPSVLLALARSTGALADVGLDVDEVAVTSSPGQFAALRDAELDLVLTSPDNVLAYRFVETNPLGELLDVSIVGGVDRGLGLALYGRPGADLGDLDGAAVGVDVPTSGFALAMYAVTESVGVPRDRYRLVSLGSTPRRARALLEGACDFTMLNAGNELAAEDAGCVRVASAAAVCAPYLGTVVAALGRSCLSEARRLTDGLHATADRVIAGELDDEAARAATDVLGLSPPTAARYVARLRDPDEGLVTGAVDEQALATLVGLRRTYLPAAGADPLADALDPRRGLVDAGVRDG